MKKVIIKRTSKPGQDAQIFRAYSMEGKSLKISASTTGETNWGVKRCAAKALGVFVNENEWSKEIVLQTVANGQWIAEVIEPA